MFRPNPAIIRFTSKGIRDLLNYAVLQISDTFGCKSDDGRIRPKHVVLYFHPLVNIVRNACCVIDGTPVPIMIGITYT